MASDSSNPTNPIKMTAKLEAAREQIRSELKADNLDKAQLLVDQLDNPKQAKYGLWILAGINHPIARVWYEDFERKYPGQKLNLPNPQAKAIKPSQPIAPPKPLNLDQPITKPIYERIQCAPGIEWFSKDTRIAFRFLGMDAIVTRSDRPQVYTEGDKCMEVDELTSENSFVAIYQYDAGTNVAQKFAGLNTHFKNAYGMTLEGSKIFARVKCEIDEDGMLTIEFPPYKRRFLPLGKATQATFEMRPVQKRQRQNPEPQYVLMTDVEYALKRLQKG